MKALASYVSEVSISQTLEEHNGIIILSRTIQGYLCKKQKWTNVGGIHFYSSLKTELYFPVFMCKYNFTCIVDSGKYLGAFTILKLEYA